MQMAVFSTRSYDRRFLAAAAAGSGYRLDFHEARLTERTATLAVGSGAVCAFVNDRLDATVLRRLVDLGIRLVALRSAGFNHVDLAAARDLGVSVGRVPAYSPHAVAEHAAALILSLDRKIHRAYSRVRDGNFTLDGLLGFDLHGRTVGIVGTGRIGAVFATIMHGFGCRLLASDPVEDEGCRALGVAYVPLPDLLARSDIVSLHCPLTPATRHLIDADAFARCKAGVMLINTSRGALVDARALIAALKAGTVGAVGLDVYEEEADLFFEDLSQQVIQDDVFVRLLTFPNVLITGHQAFFTEDALRAIAATTIANLDAFMRTGRPLHEVSIEKLA